MMILAVNVVGDGAAERDEARSRRRRRKPAFWDDETQNFRKARARFRAQDARRGVEGDEAVETAHIDERAGAVKTGIAIGTPQPDRQEALVAGAARETRQFVAKAGARHALNAARHTAPRHYVASLEEGRWRRGRFGRHDIAAPNMAAISAP